MWLLKHSGAGLKCFLSSNITKEAKITDNVEFIDIDSEYSKDRWKDAIINCDNYRRESQKEAFLKNGYDILESSKELEKLYLS